MEDYQHEYLQKIKKSKNADYFESSYIPPVELYDIQDIKEMNIFVEESDLWSDHLSIEIPRGKIQLMNGLERLSISSSDIDDNFFKNEICQLKKIKRISLHGAFLTTIPDEIINLQDLQELNIRFSRKTITSVSGNIQKLKNLKEIYLVSEIDIIPIVYKMPSLKRLFVTNNYDGEFKKYVSSSGYVNLDELRDETKT